MQVDSPRSALALVAAQLLLAPLAVRTVRAGLRRALPGLIAAVSLGASSWWIAGNDAETAVVAGARIFCIVLPGALLSAWVDYSRLGDELAQWWRLPARPVVASTAALQRLGELERQWRLLERVRHVRGLGPSRWPWSGARHLAALTFALLVQTLRRSAQLAVAMDVRGFATAQQRTFAEAPFWSGRDSALVAIAAMLALLPWASG
jgi:energy-coupling factor transporter transmembrane protein EcfT